MKNQNALFTLWFWCFYFCVAMPAALIYYALYFPLRWLIDAVSFIRDKLLKCEKLLHKFVKWFIKISPKLDR